LFSVLTSFCIIFSSISYYFFPQLAIVPPLGFQAKEMPCTYVVFSVNARHARLLPQSSFLWACRAWFIPLVPFVQPTTVPDEVARRWEEFFSRFRRWRLCIIRIAPNFSDVTASQVMQFIAAFLPFVKMMTFC
jgi:hypothetical protein